MAVDDIETLNYEDLSAVAHLAASDRYKSIMQVRASLFLLQISAFVFFVVSSSTVLSQSLQAGQPVARRNCSSVVHSAVVHSLVLLL